eukprot:Nitzschia sp. Nitz4//scaffold29_size155292//24518//28969//NITZ4_002640-RA/size155292-processed-gene-0.38-mRNA-1//-1//CDS//3329546394//8404//frame0
MKRRQGRSREDQEDLENFQRWLYSLSSSELEASMQFTFESKSKGTSSSSHELDLLMKMVKLEAPPPTPIFPGALGYKQCSAVFPFMEFPTETQRKRRRPRMFQWREQLLPRRGKQTHQGDAATYEVVARKMVSTAGDVFGVGCTAEQRWADSALIRGTFLRRAPNSTCPQLVFHRQRESDDILQMLMIASRGNISQSQGRHSSNPYCAPWLDPTQRWFSLSLYLASRFHLALWEAYTAEKTAIGDKFMGRESDFLQQTLPIALKQSLSQLLKDDQAKHIHTLRDSFAWGLVVSQDELGRKSDLYVPNSSKWTLASESLLYTPVHDAFSPRYQLHVHVSKTLSVLYTEHLQSALLEEVVPTTTPRRKPPAIRYTSKKKKKKLKRKAGKKAQLSNHWTRCETISEIPGDPSTDEITFPQNETSPRVRNRNIIMVLSILNDVVEKVFEKVGLPPTPPEEETSKKPDEVALPVATIDDPIIEEKWEQSNHAAHDHQTEEQTSLRERLPIEESMPMAQSFPTTGRFPLGGAFGAWDPIGRTAPGVPLKRFFHPIGTDDIGLNKLASEDVMGGWPGMANFQVREESILTEFFRSQQLRNEIDDGDDEDLMVASTAASISSSTYRDTTLLVDPDEMDKVDTSGDEGRVDSLPIQNLEVSATNDEKVIIETPDPAPPIEVNGGAYEKVPASLKSPSPEVVTEARGQSISPTPIPEPSSPLPEAPSTPSPTLSPILVSLADLRHLQDRLSLSPETTNKRWSQDSGRSYASATAKEAGSLPTTPTPNQSSSLRTSWSRGELLVPTFRDDQLIKERQKTFIARRSSSGLERQSSTRSSHGKNVPMQFPPPKPPALEVRSVAERDRLQDSCTRSETAVDSQREEQQWPRDVLRPEEVDNKSVTRDETTTITSALSQREPEEVSILREERNAYRDLCLTLGSEVARLKAMLAVQKATNAAGAFEYEGPFGQPMFLAASFDPNGMQPFFHGMKRWRRLGPMSDAGLHRAGEQDSQASEDDLYDNVAKSRTDLSKQVSSAATVAGSDVSVEFNNSGSALHMGLNSIAPVSATSPAQGLQSRLTKDILRFLEQTNMQLKKLDNKRRTAVERFTRLVTTIWPRAQVKLYGSHASGLCLPSSDLDFVVCLPAVHKNAPALAPGVLEGRNAIKETPQRMLARELKGESWIDQRSITLLERTVVPLIRVSTKDTRAKAIKLDISFDSPEHHGLEANEMVAHILEELPLIRPLMLILKQFLLDRGLLIAFSGGISSYCLFLMIARYLQEQPRAVGDCGSLLMGFLDFYGNNFDPRITGISVRNRQFFARPTNAYVGPYQPTPQPVMWTTPIAKTPQHVQVGPAPPFLTRRDSSSGETASVDGGRRNRRHRRFKSPATSHRYISPSDKVASHSNVSPGDMDQTQFGLNQPSTFDPLFVEDPLSSGNNVGRNAFRIVQVQRAFSDAHRALVASLEWDIHSTEEMNDGVDYPLLKCLLQSRDVLYEL